MYDEAVVGVRRAGSPHAILLACKGSWVLFVLFLGFLLFPAALYAQLIVDCSGADPNAFPSITAALQQAPLVGSTLLVTGTCSETVNVYGMIGLNLGAPYGETATVNGALAISNSQNVFLYGLHVTNSPVDGITVSDSTAVLLEACTASGNTLNGLRVQNMSDVQVIGTGGAFNNNASSGIWANVGSVLWLNNWAGPVDVSNNTLDGIECEQSTCGVLGNATFTNNGISGVDLVAGSKMEFAAYYGPNLIQGNKSGGVTARERSRISIFTPQTTIRGNGPVGVTAGFGSQVLWLTSRLPVTPVSASTFTATARHGSSAQIRLRITAAAPIRPAQRSASMETPRHLSAAGPLHTIMDPPSWRSSIPVWILAV